MTPARIVLSLCSMVAVLFMLATTHIEIPPPPAPFATPDWVPNEAAKHNALKRASELLGSITDAWGSVDVSHEDLSEDAPPAAPPGPMQTLSEMKRSQWQR